MSQVVIPLVEEFVEKSLKNRIRLQFTQLQQKLRVFIIGGQSRFSDYFLRYIL